MKTEPELDQGRVAREALWARVLEALGPDMRPCVLHNYDAPVASPGSDVDCVVPAQHLPTAFAQRLDAAGIPIVQYVRYEATAHSFFMGTRNNRGGWSFLRLDVASDFRYSTKPLLGGRIFLTEDELARSQRPFGTFAIPTPDVEFAYYLTKRIVKEDLSEDKGQALTALYRQDPAGCRSVVARFWGERHRELVCDAAASGDWTEVRLHAARLRSELLRRSATSAPTRVVGYWLRDLGRLADRWFRPSGLHVVWHGTDEAATATLAGQVAERLAPAFNGAEVERPVCAPWQSDLVTRSPDDRSGAQLRRFLTILMMAGYDLVVDGPLTWLRVRWALVQMRLVMSIGSLVDPLGDRANRHSDRRRRFRPLWRLAPRPDLIVRLDTSPGTRQEAGQQASYSLPGNGEDGRSPVVTVRIGDTSRLSEEVIDEISDAIVEHLVRRSTHRLGLGSRQVHRSPELASIS